MSKPDPLVGETLAEYRGSRDPLPVDSVVVALPGGPESAALLARSSRIAGRSGVRVHAVHVLRPNSSESAPEVVTRLRRLVDDVDGDLHPVVADDVAEAVLEVARGLHASMLVVGASSRPRWRRSLDRGVGDQIIARSGEIDVLVVTHPYGRPGGLPRRRGPSALGGPRRALGWALALVAPLLAAVALAPYRSPDRLSFEALAFMAVTVACALVGGLWPALAAAATSALVLNYFFTPPLHTWTIARPADVVTVLLFLLVGLSVASVVGAAARRAVQAGLARHEADTLTLLNQTLLRGAHDTSAVLQLVCETFAMSSAALLERRPSAQPGRAPTWRTLAAHGPRPPGSAEEGDVSAEASSDRRLVLRGRVLPAHELRILAAFATHVAVVADRDRLAEQTAAARRLEEGNRLRTVLLAAVSHDLRTPLAGIKAAVSTLRTPAMEWDPADRSALLAAIEESADRLGAIIANLLDMTRLQTGALTLVLEDVGLDDVVARSVRGADDDGRLVVAVAPDLPEVRVDSGLLERVVVNLVENALRHAPDGTPVELAAEAGEGRVRLRVVDHGPGVPPEDLPSLFVPFRRLGDARSGEGVGLGLAVAAGLTRALGGELVARPTPGGGLTMCVDLPAAPAHEVPVPDSASGADPALHEAPSA